MKITLPSLKSFDQSMDLLPIISITNNIVDLFLKVIIIPFKSPETILHNHYWKHINDKSTLRCIALIIFPILGNIVFAIYDFREARLKNPEYVLQQFNANPSFMPLENLHPILKDNLSFMNALLTVTKNPEGILSSLSENQKKHVLLDLNGRKENALSALTAARIPKAIDNSGDNNLLYPNLDENTQ